MGISTLIKTLTADDDSSLSFVDGTASVVLDSTYDEYMFVYTDIGPAFDTAQFTFQGSIDGGSNYNVTLTTTTFDSVHSEDDGTTGLAYRPNNDLAQSTSFQILSRDTGSGADESCAGILHIFSPASTTYVKHFYGRCNAYNGANQSVDFFTAGYFNDTNDVNAIQFKMNTGNFDGVIQLYGIA